MSDKVDENERNNPVPDDLWGKRKTPTPDALELARAYLAGEKLPPVSLTPADLARALLALSARCQQLEEGLHEALRIAWRRGNNEFPPADSDKLADMIKLLEAK